ncbi:hypothetical protein QWJ26_17430 [Streptomyces sp. CSDS2]|nr:hypothetical protein [Streptomyces sp. CSDS2]MDN3261568.1 hypothetical protein [Streptomyces sp. CSDS2]
MPIRPAERTGTVGSVIASSRRIVGSPAVVASGALLPGMSGFRHGTSRS